MASNMENMRKITDKCYKKDSTSVYLGVKLINYKVESLISQRQHIQSISIPFGFSCRFSVSVTLRSPQVEHMYVCGTENGFHHPMGKAEMIR